ncbi:MAG: GxxExxY protein [Planctomycetes bacterium]|nr:GxxExxY protein [Planctomycetota bacterium]
MNREEPQRAAKNSDSGELLLKDEVYAVIGAAIEVHKELGHGFLEAIYDECLGYELADRNIVHESQPEVGIRYKRRVCKKKYVPDYLCFGQIVVEIKAIKALSELEEAQLINYLRATGKPVGLLINFGARGKLEWKRMALTKE